MRKLIVCEKEYDSVRITAGESAPEQYACGQLQKYLEKAGLRTGDGLESNCRPTLPSTGTDTGSVSVTVAAYPSAAETDGA